MMENTCRMKGAITFLIQSTEDGGKIFSSLEKTLVIDDVKKRATVAELSGHYGNPLSHVTIDLNDDEAREMLQIAINKLNNVDKESLKISSEEYIDKKGNLYLRLDKQMLCLDKIALSQADAIRIKVNVKKESFIDIIEGNK